MANIAYINGQFQLTKDASISINDRGVQFGDAIYEVWAFKNRQLIDELGHFTRLSRSLNLLNIADIYPPKVLKLIFRELIARNRLKDGIIYLQISRGTQVREHNYFDDLVPNIIITARAKNFAALNAKALKGLKVKTTKDLRWARVDIKTTNLLPNILAKQDALNEGFDDVWFLDSNGLITEGSAQNAWIILEDKLITRPLANDILAGITRASIIKIAKESGFEIVERAFSLIEVQNANEAFVTSATSFVTPIVEIDNITIGNGKIGKIAQDLRDKYLQI